MSPGAGSRAPVCLWYIYVLLCITFRLCQEVPVVFIPSHLASRVREILVGFNRIQEHRFEDSYIWLVNHKTQTSYRPSVSLSLVSLSLTYLSLVIECDKYYHTLNQINIRYKKARIQHVFCNKCIFFSTIPVCQQFYCLLENDNC